MYYIWSNPAMSSENESDSPCFQSLISDRNSVEAHGSLALFLILHLYLKSPWVITV